MPPKKSDPSKNKKAGNSKRPKSIPAAVIVNDAPVEPRLECSLEELVTEKMAMAAISRPCTASYMKNEFLYDDLLNEWESFLQFAHDFSEPGKSELGFMIFPLFVQLYLMLFKVEHWKERAPVFLQKFAPIFRLSGGETYTSILNEMKNLRGDGAIKQHPYFRRFWKEKYRIRLSVGVLAQLKHLLEKISSKILLYLFNFYFCFEAIDGHPVQLTVGKRVKPSQDDKQTDSRIKKTLKRPWPSQSVVAETKGQPPEIAVRPCETELIEDMNILFPISSEICIGCMNDSEIRSVDFNENETELCVTYGDTYVFTTPLVPNMEFNDATWTIPLENMDVVEFFGNVTAVRYIPGMSHSLLVSCKNEVLILDTPSGHKTPFHPVHEKYISDLDINLKNNIQFFATASDDCTCKLWRIDDPEVIRTYTAHALPVNCVKFSPIGIYLASGATDKSVQMWDLERSIPLRNFCGHSSEIFKVAFSPTGQKIASSDSGGTVVIWDIRTGTKAYDINWWQTDDPQLRQVTSLSFLEDSLLCICNRDAYMNIIDARFPTTRYLSKKFKHVPVLVKQKGTGVLKVVLREQAYGHYIDPYLYLEKYRQEQEIVNEPQEVQEVIEESMDDNNVEELYMAVKQI